MTTVLQYLVIAAVIGLVLFGVALLLFGRGERMKALPARTSPAQLPAEAVSGADVRKVRFALAVRGYRMSDVDWTLDRLADELDKAREQLAVVIGPDDPDEDAAEIDDSAEIDHPAEIDDPAEIESETGVEQHVVADGYDERGGGSAAVGHTASGLTDGNELVPAEPGDLAPHPTDDLFPAEPGDLAPHPTDELIPEGDADLLPEHRPAPQQTQPRESAAATPDTDEPQPTKDQS